MSTESDERTITPYTQDQQATEVVALRKEASELQDQLAFSRNFASTLLAEANARFSTLTWFMIGFTAAIVSVYLAAWIWS